MQLSFGFARAMQTKRIRLGHGAVVCVPQMNHPVRVAERAATLDILSGRRLEFGTARSSTWTELGGFQVNPDDTKKTWDEYVRVLPKMWTQERFAYDGVSFSMPERAIVPKPIQKPHPPPPRAAARGPEQNGFAEVRLRSGGQLFHVPVARWWIEKEAVHPSSACPPGWHPPL